MRRVTTHDLKRLYVPPRESHKGQNGRLLVIGGSHLFHAASLWALTVASRIVDLVHYSSVPENNALVRQAKREFRNGIVVPREQIGEYIEEDDAVLIGPGMVRSEKSKIKNQKSKIQIKDQKLEDILQIEHEGEQTEALTNYLLVKYPKKQWVIDAGALQMMDVSLVPQNAILTPHRGEFERLTNVDSTNAPLPPLNVRGGEGELLDVVKLFAKAHQCIVLLKGEKDIACSGGACDERSCVPGECRIIEGGNAGMTKGGTGDVLAGLIAALACKNDPFLATITGSFINKRAGDALYEKVGPYFNATDLAGEIPVVMKELLPASR